MNLGQVDYNKQPPPAYKCHVCGAHGVKLYREYQTFANRTTLECVFCALKSQNRKADGELTDANAPDQIGWRVAAVPTNCGTTFWGYTSVPKEGCDWWYGLPVRPS